MAILDVVLTLLPWIGMVLSAAVFGGIALWWWWRTRHIKVLRGSASGDELLFIHDQDDVATFKQAKFNSAASTIEPVDDEFQPFFVPGHEGPSGSIGVSLGGRRIFPVFRGLGVVQSFEGALASMIAEQAEGVNDSSDMAVVQRPDGVVPLNEIEDARRRELGLTGTYGDDDFVVIKDGTMYGPFGGVAVSLKGSEKFAPFRITPTLSGDIKRAERAQMEQTKGWSPMMKFIMMALILIAAMVIGVVVVTSVLGGGGGGGGGRTSMWLPFLAGPGVQRLKEWWG